MGGSFGMFQGMINGFHLARFSGAPDSFEPLASFNGPVNALAANPFISDAIGLYAGGEFTQNVADTVQYVAETILTSGMNELQENVGIALFPNPAHDRLTVTLYGPSEHVILEIVDAQGRTVLTHPLRGGTVTLDVKQLANGPYTLRAVGSGPCTGTTVRQELREPTRCFTKSLLHLMRPITESTRYIAFSKV